MPLIIFTIVIAIFLMLYFINMRLTPTSILYAENQSTQIASDVISKAVNSKNTERLDISDIMLEVPGTGEGGTVKVNTKVINEVMSDTQELVQSFLKKAEAGDLDVLPQNINYDTQAMAEHGGIVFFVPIGQATNIPLLGNLGPKIPIRFHVIGNVSTDLETNITDWGINNSLIEVNVLVTVNVQIIIPLATKTAVVQQRIPVAMGIFKGPVPQFNSTGTGATRPSIDIQDMGIPK